MGIQGVGRNGGTRFAWLCTTTAHFHCGKVHLFAQSGIEGNVGMRISGLQLTSSKYDAALEVLKVRK